jgi:hypothetical protein
MKTTSALAFLLLLSGCVTDTVWYKEGANPAAVNSAATDCAVEAANRVPQNTQVGVTPTYSTPVQTYCNNTGYGTVSCTSYGGDVYGGNVYSYDANQGLRNQVMEQCMARRGYALLSLPVCSPDQAAKAKLSASRLPAISETSCLVQTGSGYVVASP